MRSVIKYLRKEMFGGKVKSPTELADVFVCTMKGRGGTLYRMTIEDAKKLCSDERTKGKRFADEWMLMWSSYDLVPDDFFMKDDGRFAEIIDELNIKIIKTMS